jgi:hypothetical protein
LIVAEIDRTSSIIAYVISTWATIYNCRKIMDVTNNLICLDTGTEQPFLTFSTMFFFHTRVIPFTMGVVLLGLIYNSLQMLPKIAFIVITPICFVFYLGSYIPVLQFSDSVTIYGRFVIYLNKQLDEIHNKMCSIESICGNNQSTTGSRIHLKTEQGLNYEYTQFNQLEIFSHPSGTNESFLRARSFNTNLRRRISHIARFHNTLCDIIQNLNSAFSLQVLVNVVDVFVKISAGLFCSVCILMEGVVEFRGFIIVFVSCSFALLKILTLVRPCIASTDEVS